MMQGILVDLAKVKGVHNAIILDAEGELLAYAGTSPLPPQTQPIINTIVNALHICHITAFQGMEDIWIDGPIQTFVRVLSQHRLVCLQGKNGQYAAWKHQVNLRQHALKSQA